MRLAPERFQLVQDEANDARMRWEIVLRGNGTVRDLYLMKFHPSVPKETAAAVLGVLRRDPYLPEILK